MKYLELSYILTDTDKRSLEKMQNQTYFRMKLRYVLIYAVFALIFVFFKMYAFGLICFALGLIDSILPVILNGFSLRKMGKTAFQSREIKLEFYDNHFVFFKLPNGKFKGTEERHFPFDEVSAVMENAEYFYFVFADGSTIVLPKRICDSEKAEMISNLIANVFSKNHIKI